MAAEYEVNIKINSQEIERELGKIDRTVAKIGKPKGGGARRKSGIAGLLPSSEELRAAEKGLVQLAAKTKNIQNIQDKFSERRTRALIRSNALNEKELRLNKQLTAEARARLRLLSQAGAKGFEGTRPQGRQLSNDINARAKAQDKRARLLNKINEMEAKGLNVEKLRKQLSKATTEQSARRFAGANKEFNILRKIIELEESKLRILKEQQRNFPSSPIRGTAAMMGSPAQIAASGRQIASPIRGGLSFPGSPGFLAGATVSRTPFGPAGNFPTSLGAGGARLSVMGGKGIAGSPAQMEAIKKFEMAEIRADKNVHFAELKLIQRRQKVELDNIDKLLAADLRALKKFDSQLEASDKARQKRLAGANAGRGQFGPAAPGMQGPRQMIASPIGGAVNIPGSPAFLANQRRSAQLAQQRKNGARRFQNIATGAGFPLLFGGGPLQAIAGGVGGAFGGLGGSIAATAAISQLQAFGQTAAEIGQAVSSTGGALDLMQEKALFSTKAIERQAAALEEQGKVQELNALITQELANKIGNEGIRSLQELGKTTDQTSRLWSELTTQLAALISGPLNGFLSIVNQVLGAVTGAGRREAFFGDLGAQEGAARARFKELTGESLGTGRSGQKARQAAEAAGRTFLSQDAALAQIRTEFQAVNPAQIPITAADTKRFTVKNTAADKAAREEQRLRERLAKLEEERKKVLEISRFRDKIAAAEAAKDEELVIRLQGEQRIAEIEASRLKALVGVADQRERDAINIGKATEKLAAHRTTERELGELQRQSQEKFEDTIEGLEHQLKLAQATSEAERERLRIEKKLQELRDDEMSESQVGQIGQLMEQISAENSPLNKFIKQSVESLNDLETQAVQVAQGIGNAIGNSLVNGMQNLITGAQSVKEVFADMLKSIADVLAQQAAQMIATYIAIGVARLFAGIDGGNEGGSLNLDAIEQYSGVGANTSFAEGGYVSGPTRALVGEGGESEYIIPESKMRESMARYSRGARGGSVIPGAGDSGTSGEGGGTAVAAPIDVRYTVERINSVDYVTADQFQTGMRQAASQGAKQGEQQTLKRLQMSGSTRKRLGL